MTPVVREMMDQQVALNAANEACSPISCKDCGIFGLCREINGADVDLSLPETIVRSRRLLKRGELLFGVGDTRRSVYAIRSGSIKSYVTTDDGRVQITGFHISGELLGLSDVVADHMTSEARVLETTMVCEVPHDVLKLYCDQMPSVRKQVIKIMGNELLDNQNLMLLLGKKNAEERLATFLFGFSRRFQKRNYSAFSFNLSMSRSDIGNYLGMAEETVCRVFTRFQDDGLLTTQRRQVRIHDLARLKAIARG